LYNKNGHEWIDVLRGRFPMQYSLFWKTKCKSFGRFYFGTRLFIGFFGSKYTQNYRHILLRMNAMALQWYVLRSKPNKEDALFQQVNLLGFEAFYPRQAVTPVNPRARKTRPYFTSYMFVNIDLQEIGLSTFQWMPYSAGLVNFDGEPAAIPANIMQPLIKNIETLTKKESDAHTDFLPGNPLKILSGPFAGYEAIFDTRRPGDDRIRILLSLAKGNQVSVELPSFQVGKID
jgi:transcriptional antiterminator RfaH